MKQHYGTHYILTLLWTVAVCFLFSWNVQCLFSAMHVRGDINYRMRSTVLVSTANDYKFVLFWKAKRFTKCLCVWVFVVCMNYTRIYMKSTYFMQSDTLGHSHKDFNRIRLYHRMQESLVLVCISVSFLATFATYTARQMCIQSHPSFETMIRPAKLTQTHTHEHTPIC